MQGITFLKKGDESRALSRSYGFHMVVDMKEVLSHINMSYIYKTCYMTLFITFRVNLIVIYIGIGALDY